MEYVWKFKVVDQVLEVYVIGRVTWYNMVRLVRKCWNGGAEEGGRG